ncbi:MAG: hypothetical protein JST71_07460 [Bacteroidetes bacterium]|jgi:hypothetical protein|nr:hypothetical protein [Bacteroidota bacterium]MBX7238223.1 hypothetical protein [Bacteroidia bacterium]MCC7513506.1 hypothetical protein [Bacteroidia bacterium]MCW5919551.1 hypothetical protein [Bacteroidota bacterium]HCI58800.1 hypothetical protein [Bacteroidota bacterium]
MIKTTKIFAVLVCLLVVTSLTAFGQKSKVNQEQKITGPGKCLIKTDSLLTNELTKEDLIKWVENPPFIVNCQDTKTYKLKFYEFTILKMKPFENKSFGVGDDRMIPILGRKAINDLKEGDTVILKGVDLIEDGTDKTAKAPTISIKIIEKQL